ncbi:ABC transporter [Nocardioides luteus]|uniref:ABC transporter n=1 Tax=Nocardioides luteus TaxID=1844 RepID=A0A1J4NAI6_9ACTN|nr:ABC transporter [Nocardioides luteus]OIJ28522.1 ABC transporter [Nocardioides luteus]
MHRRTLAGIVTGLTLAATGCGSTATPADDTDADPGSGKDHGAVEGAREVAEPQLHLTTIDGTGNVAQLDLIEGSSAEVGRIGEPSAVASDGRYLFATTAEGVEVVDSGMWTWDHGDHFHYYRGEPRLLGAVEGEGPATVATGPLSTAGSTGVYFDGSGDAVLLDNKALAGGEVRERFRVDGEPHQGLVAPLGNGALVTVAEDGAVTGLRYHGADGDPAGAQIPCARASGTITTKVGVVVGCADGAVLATETDGRPGFERIAYPKGIAAPRATAFDGRKSRPTVAALSGRTGIWLLDTRERTWTHLDARTPLRQVVAADDEDGHVLALDTAGRVRVLSAEGGKQLAVTEPLVDPSDGGVDLVVDQERAYLNVPAEGVVHEIDYADRARIARTLETPTAPVFFAETGR